MFSDLATAVTILLVTRSLGVPIGYLPFAAICALVIFPHSFTEIRLRGERSALERIGDS